VTPIELIRDAPSKSLTTKKGEAISLELRGPVSAGKIAGLEARLPCPLPADVRELLAYCGGFSGGGVDFASCRGHRSQNAGDVAAGLRSDDDWHRLTGRSWQILT